MVALYVVATGLEALAGSPMPFTVATMICLVFDGQRGLFRSVRPMPVTRRAQALAWWIIGVPLPSLVALFPAIAGTAVHVTQHSSAEPWFVMWVQALAGLGISSLCFLLATLLPTRQPANLLETLGQALIGLCWGVLFPGSLFLMQALPKTMAAVHPWHWALAAAVPVLILLSLLTAPEMLMRRSSPVVAPVARKGGDTSRRGITGIPFYLLQFGGRMALLLFAMAAIQVVALRLIFGHSGSMGAPFHVQIVMMALLFGIILSDLAGVRSLRTLPLSTLHLTLLLLSLPIIAGLVAGLIVVLFFPGGHAEVLPITRMLLIALVVSGFGSLSLALMLRITSGYRMVIMIFLGIVPAALTEIGFRYPVSLASASLVAGFAGFALVLRGLRRSSAVYQPKTFFGNVAGQPFGMR